jgi:beta-glucosidase
VSEATPVDGIQARVDELISRMTPAEKAGQLTQYFYFRLPAGAAPEPALGMDPDAQPRMVEEALGRGEVGSIDSNG